jgi:transcriptional regulator with GAF, ATPase, and Fis domain/GGDEF domain-containing protein
MGLIQRAREIAEKLPRSTKPDSNIQASIPQRKKGLLARVQELVEHKLSSESSVDISPFLKEQDGSVLLDMDAVDSQLGNSTPVILPNTNSEIPVSQETEDSDLSTHFGEDEDIPSTLDTDDLEIIDIDALPDFEDSDTTQEELKKSFELDKTPEKEPILEDFAGEKETVDIGEDSISQMDFDESKPLPEETFELESNLETDDPFSDWEKDAQEESSKDPLLNLEDSIMKEISKEDLASEDLENPIPPLENLKTDLDESKKALEEQASVSNEEWEALQRRTESYLVLVEITKDLMKSKTFEDFFENLMYSIEGQLGPEVILIFGAKERNFKEFHLVAYDGIEIEMEPVISSTSTLAKRINDIGQPVFASTINKEGLDEHELMILENPTTEIIAPIIFDKQLVGFIIAGKLVTEEQYSEDDFEFLKLLGDIAGNFIIKMFDLIKIREEVTQLNESIKYHEALANLSGVIYGCKSIGELYEKTTSILEKDFSITKHTLFLISEHEYKAFQSNYFSQETISNLTISVKSKLVALVSQVTGMYKIENFNTYAEFKEIIPEKELAEMQEFSVFPLIHMGKLFGLFVVHEIALESWTPELKQMMISASNMLSPAIANFILQTERDVVFKNPFNPLQESVDREIEIATNENTRFTLVVLKILNVSRIINLLGLEFFSSYSDFVISKIQKAVSESDYFSRVGQGKFAIFLRGKDKAQSEEFFHALKTEFMKFPDPPKNFKLSIQLYSLTYPDQAKDKRKFIELIEDT